MEKRNNLYEKALEFSKQIIFLYRELDSKGLEKEISKQFLRSGNSVGANIAEAQGSISEADYVSKIHIAYKELLETKYWIELLTETSDLDIERSSTLIDMINEISKIIYTILRNIRNKKSK